jgi:hypothetical protein
MTVTEPFYKTGPTHCAVPGCVRDNKGTFWRCMKHRQIWKGRLTIPKGCSEVSPGQGLLRVRDSRQGEFESSRRGAGGS